MKVYIRHQRGRMFESDFLELFSRVHPAAPFVFWIPACGALLAYGLTSGFVSAWRFVVFAPLGFLSWQLTEYFVHKKLFHWPGNGPITRRLHDILHGFHHRYPDDETRLVMPLAVSISTGATIGGALYACHRPDMTLPFFLGFAAGYMFYDFMHWSTHFRKPLTAWGRVMRAHHMSHHFADIDTNFGISHRYVDRLLGTLRKRRQ